MPNGLITWTIYNKPLDYPGGYLARKFDGMDPTEEYFTSGDLEALRERVRVELGGHGVLMKRSKMDHPNVIETWF